MVSFTITEKGYALADLAGRFFPAVEATSRRPLPLLPRHVPGVRPAAGALPRRRRPVAMVSMDNCSTTGRKLRAGILTVRSSGGNGSMWMKALWPGCPTRPRSRSLVHD
jgi:fructuronate reductase